LGARPMFDEQKTAAAATSTEASTVNGVFIWGPHSRSGCGPRAADNHVQVRAMVQDGSRSETSWLTNHN
jgi:hypothetical protein